MNAFNPTEQQFINGVIDDLGDMQRNGSHSYGEGRDQRTVQHLIAAMTDLFPGLTILGEDYHTITDHVESALGGVQLFRNTGHRVNYPPSPILIPRADSDYRVSLDLRWIPDLAQYFREEDEDTFETYLVKSARPQTFEYALRAHLIGKTAAYRMKLRLEQADPGTGRFYSTSRLDNVYTTFAYSELSPRQLLIPAVLVDAQP